MNTYPIQLTGPRLLLREFEADDVNALLAIVGDERVTDWLSFEPRTAEETQKMLAGVLDRARAEPRQEFYLAIERCVDHEIVGSVRLALSGVRAGQLGYALRPDAWGNGYATEAIARMLDFGFKTLDLHRISAAIGPENAASISVVERLGMTYEGTIRDHVHTNGAWRDSRLFSLLDHEWEASQAQIAG